MASRRLQVQILAGPRTGMKCNWMHGAIALRKRRVRVSSSPRTEGNRVSLGNRRLTESALVKVVSRVQTPLANGTLWGC